MTTKSVKDIEINKQYGDYIVRAVYGNVVLVEKPNVPHWSDEPSFHTITQDTFIERYFFTEIEKKITRIKRDITEAEISKNYHEGKATDISLRLIEMKSELLKLEEYQNDKLEHTGNTST